MDKTQANNRCDIFYINFQTTAHCVPKYYI